MAGTFADPINLDDENESDSIASTPIEDYDSEQEWEVKDVLAEGVVGGTTKYLIEWGDFPLYEASWEPAENLGDTMIADWEEAKKQSGHKQASNKRIRAWRQAVRDRLYGKLARHEERNRKRVARNMEPTTYDHPLENLLADLEVLPKGEDEDDDEADDEAEDNIEAKGEEEDISLRDWISSRGIRSPSHQSPEVDETPNISPIQPPVSPVNRTQSQDIPSPSDQSPEVDETLNISPTQPLASSVNRIQSQDIPSPSDQSPEDQTLNISPTQLLASSVNRIQSQDVPSPSDQLLEEDQAPNISPTQPPVPSANRVLPQDVLTPSSPSLENQTPNVSPKQHPIPLTSGRSSRNSSRNIGPTPKPKKSAMSAKLAGKKAQKPSLEADLPQPTIRRTSLETSNVFVGGKEARQRRSLSEIASDPNKGSVMLRHRYQRKLQLASRDKEGVVAPAHRPNLFYLTQDGAPSMNDSTSEGVGDAQPPSSSNQPNTQQSTAEITETPSQVTKKKKKKTVCFVDEPEAIEPNPEPSLFFDDPEPIISGGKQRDYSKEQINEHSNSLFTLPGAVVTSAGRLNLGNGEPQTIRLTKDTKFSSTAMDSIPVTFNLPTNTMSDWLSKLNSEQTLIFTHACTAKDYRQQYPDPEHVLKGTLTSPNHFGTLEATAHRLRLGSFGLLCHLGEFCILVHPIECEGWVMQTQHTDENVLGFIMIEAGDHLRRCDLAPISFSPDVGHQDLPPGMRPALLSRILGLDYSSLLPSSLQNTTNHPFFLAFPPTAAAEEAKFLAQWLRSSNPDSKILTSLFGGHWFSFLNCPRGVVIVHEDAAWTIRLFPSLHKLLATESDRFTFWMFERSLKPHTLVARRGDAISEIGDIRLQPIFEYGVAVLLTPSFFVSKHNQAYAFVNWYNGTQDTGIELHRRPKLVVCAKPDEWLFGLHLNKLDQLKEASIGAHHIIKEAAETTLETWRLIRDLVETSKDQESDLSPLVFAPDAIDGNDEQSLVNWFGWWSIMNMSQFREFTLLGSGPNPHPASLVRYMECPRFTQSTTGNPEEVYRQVDQTDSRNAPFRIIANDQPSTLTNHLDKLIKEEITPLCPLVLYKFPVSYWHKDMSFHFRDYSLRFSDYYKCFRWFNSFAALQQGKCHNTLTALFYTIEEHWDPAAFPSGVVPPRRPWIAMHRPINLHKKPWVASELLIWDLTPKEELKRRKEVYVSDLIEAQREFIRIFNEENKLKNYSQPIERVWVGGFNASWNGFANQVDATLVYYRDFIRNTQHWLPIPERFMRERGWEVVIPGRAPPSPSVDAMDIDEPTKIDNTDDMKIVFHPPQGKHTRGTKCQNRLYQHAKDFLRNRSAATDDLMEYTFRPTLEWYQEQLAEGRGYEHITVTTWEQFAERDGIRANV